MPTPSQLRLRYDSRKERFNENCETVNVLRAGTDATKRLTLVLFVLVVLLTCSVAMVAWATGDNEWVQVPSYSSTGELGRKPLTSISFSSSSNGNAVGWDVDNDTRPYYVAQAQHWDGSSWQNVAIYNNQDTNNFLYGVVTISSSDAWAVGQYGGSEFGGGDAMILHYDSNSDEWVNGTVSVPNSTESVLTSVTANSSTDVWAVGYYMPDCNGCTTYKTLIMHYNGTSWSVVSSPNVTTSTSGALNNKLFGVTNVPGSSNLFWAAGAYEDASGNIKTLILQGNTTSTSPWTIVSSYNASGTYNCLRSVSALDSSNAWAVGFRGNLCFDLPNNDSPSIGNGVLIEMWGGSQWNQETPSGSLPDETQLYGVSVASNSLVWAVGYYTQTIVLGRDSSGTWSKHSSESPDQGEHQFNRLLGVDALSESLAWASGWYYDETTGDKPTLIEHYVPPSP